MSAAQPRRPGPPERSYRDRAFALRRIDFGETDRIVVLFTRERGKLSAIAKGARRPLSRLAAACEPFAQSSVQLAAGQRLDILTQCRVERAFPRLRERLQRVGYACHVLELCDAGLVERQPHPDVWDLLTAVLERLEQAEQPDLLVRAFELQMLGMLGFAPELEHCVRCRAPLEREGAGFHPEGGGGVCRSCRAQLPGSLACSPEALRLLLGLQQSGLAGSERAAASTADRRILARCLIAFLRGRLEAPLRSIEFAERVDGLLSEETR